VPAGGRAPRGAGSALSNSARGLSLGIVVGLAAEARIARRLGGRVAIGGGTSDGARRAARDLAESGATALLSFGLAGGLDPALRPGDLLVPHTVLAGGRRFPTDPALCGLLGGSSAQMLLGGERIVAEPGEKHVLWRTTGCAAVDLESAAVAEVATERNLPFAVLRAVADPADRAVPPAALTALDAKGAVTLGRVLVSLVHQPGQLAALLALARDAVRARRSLLRHLAHIGAHGTFTPAGSGRARSPGDADARYTR
jgi:adenosylhomocysteine nucleosidase